MMADEYIKRNTALKFVNRWHNQLIATYGTDDEYVKCLEAVATYLKSLRPAAVRPVVYGKWLHGREVGREYVGDCITGVFYEDWKCSVCGYCINDRHYSQIAYNHCPNCGADMRPSEEPESLTYIPPEERSGVDDDGI